MAPLINRKKEKTERIYSAFGRELSEASFIAAFIETYPDDWKRIQERWDSRVPDMQEPMVYMKEMYRNHRPSGG